MDTSIDGLFQQIIVFEQAAQKRKNCLGEYKQQVHVSQDELQQVNKKCLDLCRNIQQKVNELSNKELECRSYAIQETTYQQQKSASKQQLDDLIQKKTSEKDDFFQECQIFCEQVGNLCSKFGQNSTNKKKQTHNLTDAVTLALQKEKKLQEDLQKLSEKKKTADKLKEEKRSLQNQCDSMSEENKKVKQSLLDLLEVIMKLDEERYTLTDQPQKASTYLSLQTDLDEGKRVAAALEEEILELQAQLQEAQHKLWQRNFHQKSKPRNLQHTDQEKQMERLNTQRDIGDFFGDSEMEDIFDEEFTTDDFSSTQASNNDKPDSNTDKPMHRKSLFKMD